jgi:ABC-type Fe3+/spermidine/putrescine transport system ATPase subunit
MVGMAGFEGRPISELSGGEQQRVALARSLAIEPQVLLLDEPLSNLDARLRGRMRREIKALQRSLGITTVFVTHDQTEALTLSDRITVLQAGRCVQTGTPDHIYTHPRTSFVARFIGDTNLFEASIKDGTAALSAELTLRLPCRRQTGRYLSIRPQDIRLSVDDPQATNSFPGRVAGSQLNGVWIEHRVAVHRVELRACELNTSTGRLTLQPGDRLYVTLPPEHIAVLEA